MEKELPPRPDFDEFRRSQAEQNKVNIIRDMGQACERQIANLVDKTSVSDAYLAALQLMLAACQVEIKAILDAEQKQG